MSAGSGRKKSKKILDLPQDLVINIVGKILQRAEQIRQSINTEEEPKTELGRKAKKAAQTIEKTSKKVIKTSKKAVEKAKKIKAKTTKKRK